MRKLLFLSLLLLSISSTTINAAHTQRYRISLLTYSEGVELYSAFGHSAIRVIDSALRHDYVYNYGMFNFSTPNFYGKFMKGKLSYHLARIPTGHVFEESKEENRYIIENEFILTGDEANYLVTLLKDNNRPENREYLYDFFYDNCSTRILDMIDSATHGRFKYNLPVYQEKSFASLYSGCLTNNKWGNLGINIAMGAEGHKKATMLQTSFLPDYLQALMANAIDTTSQARLLGRNRFVVRSFVPSKKNKLTPIFAFSILLLFVLVLKILEIKSGNNYRLLNTFILLPPIILGFVLITLWAVSDHGIYSCNYSLVWMNPLWLVFFNKKLRNKKGIMVLGHLMLIAGLCVSVLVLHSSALILYIGAMWLTLISIKE